MITKYILLFTALAVPQILAEVHPDAGLNIYELLERYEYPYTRHWLTTDDGYIIEVQQISGRYNNDIPSRTKPPVLIMHGLSSSSVDFVNTGPDKALGMLLADMGYDVWLGNSRGNFFGRNHTTLDPDVDLEQFWDISWHHIGIHDIPTTIDFMLANSDFDDIYYIGHSQGGTSFFVMCTQRPEYNDKIRVANLMGPAGFMDDMRSPFLQIIAQYEEDLAWIAEFIGLYEFKPHFELTEAVGALCASEGFIEEICMNIYFLMFGYDSSQMDPAMLSVLLTNLPSGSATKQYLHYAQGINTGYFRLWDYHNETLNIEHYGQPVPPDYDLTKITAPVALHYGQNDWIVGIPDIQQLRDIIPNCIVDNLIAYEFFNHVDFLCAKDIVELLYNDIFAIMESYKK